MILYSVIPPEVVFGNNQDNYYNSFREIDYMGQKVQVAALSNNEFVITRLISTSPGDYLNPRFQPGTVIKKGNI